MFNVRLRSAAWAVAAASLMLTGGCMSRMSDSQYASYESMLRSDGKLRTETAPADAPYGADDLVRNFERIALRKEANATRAGGDANSTATPLRRWEGPLRYRIDGSAATPADRAEVARLMTRIAGLTGLEISESATDPNFRIVMTVPAERDRMSAELAGVSPRFRWAFDYWRSQGELVCIADKKFAPENGNLIVSAMAVIGSETTGILRQSCLHEEIVQALGLSNDHPAVRPSIFNDDAEFALLTNHDAQLLRILYDPRLKIGMNAAEADPVVHRIVAEITQ